jgi:hypothetical protein
MAYAQNISFDKRLQRINKSHDRLSRGYVMAVNPDGLVVMRPQRRQVHFPLRGILLLAVATMAFKAFLYAEIGPGTYQDRVARLGGGTLPEAAGAWLMQADPVTVYLGSELKPYLPE